MGRGYKARGSYDAFDAMTVDNTEFDSYHRSIEWRKTVRVPIEERRFIAWDGEGAQDGNRQNYVLFGASTGDSITSESGLSTIQIVRFLIAVGKANPSAWHVGFAFEYDTNMVIRSLTARQLRILRDKGAIRFSNFRVEHVPSKWLQVTEYGPAYPGDKRDKFTVRINDMFGFFQCSFVKALKSYLPNHPLMEDLDIIEAGKDERNNFTYARIEYIQKYWTVEIALMEALADELRARLYRVGLYITRWHGPGALANYAYKKNGIAAHKADCGHEVYDAARYAYAGGRFERFHIGRYRNGWGIDINSAYPYGISRLPSLSEGTWRHVEWPDKKKIVEFGVYKVRVSGSPVSQRPGPLFHRDQQGNMSYPWLTSGWYWSPEVSLLKRMPDVEILEGWEYTGWETRPFAFVQDVYEQRREMKARGDGAQIALKLLLNSLYGKMAQRVGWERSGRAPTWHQLEWAGWVTSATRAKLFAVMARIPYHQLIAVETDGIYTTANPADLSITNSDQLGGWEVSPFEEIRYVQSGMYSKLSEGKWETKYRGLDARSITPDSLETHLKLLLPNSSTWPTLTGPTTRFVGYKQALWREDMNMGPMKVHHCKWETQDKELAAGTAGKRVHLTKLCQACHAGATAWESPHDTVIRSRSLHAEMSTRHDIPWLNDQERPEWRDYAEGLAS